jgi:hypothetical protein
MPNRDYLRAVVYYVLIPLVVLAGGGLYQLIDPEWARGHADYTRNYRWLELARVGVLMAAGAGALALWLAACAMVLKARQRSIGWLALAVAGPFGLIGISLLGDRSPAPHDRHVAFVAALKWVWRIPYELALFIAMWALAFAGMLLKREVMIHVTSFRTDMSVDAIVEMQNASSGMHAFGEGIEVLYLVGLCYLLWPVVFSGVARVFCSLSRSPSR